MSTQRQLRRGTTSQIAAATPAQGELWADTTIFGRLVVGDGSTAGGFPLPYISSGVLNGANAIKFPSIQVPSSDVNTLDDYEEGTWTPTVTFGGGSTGITYTQQQGNFTKIGNRILFDGLIILSSKGSSAGVALIVGLPLSAASICYSGVSCRFTSVLSSISGLTGYVEHASTQITLQKMVSGTVVALFDTDFTNTTGIVIGGQYRV